MICQIRYSSGRKTRSPKFEKLYGSFRPFHHSLSLPLGFGNISGMEKYSHTQIGYTILLFIGVAIVLILLATPLKNIYLSIAILMIISVLFCTLTIKIIEETIHWYFGPYFWKKS